MKIRKAVITAAGRGTRQYPATQVVQKEMIPLVDRDGVTKPVLQIIIEEALASGIEEIGIVAAPEDQETFRNYFRGMDAATRRRFSGNGKAWGLDVSDRLAEIGRRLTILTQPSPEGYGHAVRCARDWVGDEPFLLLLGDHVYVSREERTTMRQVLDTAERYGESVFAVRRTPEERLYLYGTVAGTSVPDEPGVYRITDIKEKPDVGTARERFRVPGVPAGEYLCFFGMHALRPSIFACLDDLVAQDRRERGEFQFTSAQEMLLQREPVLALEVNGEAYDMGIPLGLLETQIALALNGRYRDEVRAFWTEATSARAIDDAGNPGPAGLADLAARA